MNFHHLPMTVKTNYCPGHPVSISLVGPNIRIRNTFKRFGIGAVPHGESGRKVDGGPLVDGPWAYAFGLCVVIDNFPERRAAEYAKDVEVDDGDRVEIDLSWYSIKVVRGEFIELVPCEAPPPPPPVVGKDRYVNRLARHTYEVECRSMLYGMKPRDGAGNVCDVLMIRVDANSRTSAAKICRDQGYNVASVNMLG